MAASVKTTLKIDDKELKEKLDAISKYYKTTYNEWTLETQKLNKASTVLEQSQLDLQKAVAKLKLEQEKGTKANKKSIAVAKEDIKVKALQVKLDKMQVGSIKSKMSAQTAEMAQMKMATSVLKEKNITQKTATKTTTNMTNSIVRHLRQVETLVIAYYALSRGYQNTIGLGIEVNKMMEDNTSGIAALLSANTQMVLSNGAVVDSYEKFVIGQKIASKTMEDIKKASVDTFATFPQLTQLVQQSIGHTLGMGKSFGRTTDEIIKNTIKFTQSMSNIGGSVGMEMQKVQEEVRSMLSGNVSTDSLLAVMLFGSPTEANKAIKEAKKRGENGVSDMLSGMMEAFEPLKDVDTYTKNVLKLENAWSIMMQKLSEPVFNDLKDVFKELTADIENNTESIVESFNDIYEASKTLSAPLQIIAEQGRTVSEVMDMIGTSAKETFEILGTSNELDAFSTTMLGISVILETVNAGISNFATVASSFSFKVGEGDSLWEQITGGSAGFDLDEANKNIVTIDGILIKYEAAYAKIQGIKEKAIEKTKKDLSSEDEKLLTKIAADYVYIGKRLEENNKALEETLKLQNKIEKSEEQLGKLGQIYSGTTTDKLREATLISINGLTKSIANDEKEIADIKLKAQQKLVNSEQDLFVSTQKALGVEVSKKQIVEWNLNSLGEQLAITKDTVEQNNIQAKIMEKVYAWNVENTKEVKTAKELMEDFAEVSELYAIKQDEKIDTEYYNVMNDSYMSMLDTQLSLAESTQDWQNGLTGVAGEVASVGTAFSKLNVLNIKHQKTQAELDKEFTKNWIDLYENKEDTYKLEQDYIQNTDKINTQNTQNQIAGYGQLAGAMAGMFEENSKESKALIIVQQTLALTNAVASVVAAGTNGDAYTAPARVAAMLAIVTPILAMAGIAFGGGGGASSPHITQEEYDEQETESTLIADRLDRQIELLESIDRAGSANVAMLEKSGTDYKSTMDKMSLDIADAFYIGIGNAGRSPIYDSAGEFSSLYADDFEKEVGFDLISELGGSFYINADALKNDLGATLSFLAYFSDNMEQLDMITAGDESSLVDGWINDAQNALNDYAMSMVDVVDEMSSASEKFKDLYDDLTGTTKYEDLELEQAQKDVDALRGSSSLESYIEEQIRNITAVEDAFDGQIQDLLMSSDPADMQDQVDALKLLEDATGVAFDDGVEDALNYIDSIELVAEAMIESNEVASEAAQDLIDDVYSLSDAFSSLGDSIDETIATLLGGVTGTGTQDSLIDSYWEKRAELDVLLAKDGDLTASEQDSLTNLVGDVNQLSLDIQGSTVGDNEEITQSLVDELSGLKAELDFDNEILNVRIVEFENAFSLTSTDDAEIGVLSALPSYDVGSNYIPYDQVAMIHRGERILTASQNRDFTFNTRTPANNTYSNEALVELKLISARLEAIEKSSATSSYVLDEAQYGQRTLKVEVVNG